MNLKDVVSLDLDGRREYGTIVELDHNRAKVKVDLMRGGTTTAYRLISELSLVYPKIVISENA